MKIASDSDESVVYRRVHSLSPRDDSIVWRWQCGLRYRIHRRVCKQYAKPRKNTVAGEDKVYEPTVELEYLDEESGEALCPLWRFCLPDFTLKNLHDHQSEYHTPNERGDSS